MPSRITGFTVIRNAVLMGYPVLEAIRSILPVVDDYVVAVGAGDDDTRALIASIDDPKLRIVDTVWDTTKNRGGTILSEKTNEALALCEGDWCFYLQADEVVHERDLPRIRAACDRYLADTRVEGLLFKYLHFYGSFHVVASARNWYRHEVRIVRNGIGAHSVGDAQSFMVTDHRTGEHKPRVMATGASIHHYGWVKAPDRMERKQSLFSRWYDGPAIATQSTTEAATAEVSTADAQQTTVDAIPAAAPPNENWQFRQLYGLRRYTGDHPAVMQHLVDHQHWQFEPRFTPGDWNKRDWKNALSDVVEGVTRRRWGERKKYVLLKP